MCVLLMLTFMDKFKISLQKCTHPKVSESGFLGYAKIPYVRFFANTGCEAIEQAWVFVCVRTMCGALTGQCSVQCRREQRRPRPVQTQYPGNPCVFRSPGPYLMSLSKKKVALSGVFLSHCLPLALLFPSFSHASPSSTTPPSPGATLRMNGFQVFTQQLCLSLYVSLHFT